MYSNTLIHLERWRQDHSLGSMATVVDLSKGNTYLAILLVWCMSGTPHVFDSKTCARVELIRVVHSGAPCVFDGKRALVMSYSCGAPRVIDG